MTDGPVQVPSEAELQADLATQAGRDAGQDTTLAALSDKVDALTAQVADLASRPVGGALDVSALGLAPLDQYPGASDAEKWTNAISAIGAITGLKPTLKLPARSLDLRSANPIREVPGLSVEGLGRGTEFDTMITCPAAGLLAGPGSKGRMTFRRLSLWGNFMPALATNGSQGVWKDIEMESIGIRAGRLLSGAFTRAKVDDVYINALTSEPGVNAYFTDSWLFPTYCTASGTTAPGVPILRIAASMTRMGAPYVTPQGGAGIEIFYSMGGFTIDGAKADSWRRSLSGASPALGVAPASAGWKINNTVGLSIRDLWINNVNAQGADPGDVVVGASNTDLVFYHPTFAKTYDGQTSIHSGPAIYTQSPIKVYDPVALGGYPKGFKVGAGGSVSCNDSSWPVS